MNFRFTVVETSLNRAEFRWKWLRFLERSLLLGIVLTGLVMLFGGVLVLGWVASKALAITFFTLVAVLGFIAWAVIIIAIAAGNADRPWLAAAIERVDPRLLDRLNTLVSLERERPNARVESFARRIAKGTQRVLVQKASPTPFHGTRPFRYFLTLLALVLATIWFYGRYSPWDALKTAQKTQLAKATPPDKPLELTPPATNSVEQNQSWGEVRITDPGADMRVTKVDVVPLQIEAAANQGLKQVNWSSTVNGADETAHPLPPPSEPRYAVYQPTLYLDELNLSDWDVMTYYAKARTEKEDSYASEMYFLEVRPFREDILKMPGGENGQAYQCLSELSALIGRQQHVIRQTHQHIQKPPEQESLQAQDRKKLSEAESDLSDSTQHLYAKMAGQMENKPIGEALDNLAKAEKSLDRASQLLQTNVMNEARNRERSALTELVAARKMFQKAISEHPKDFEDPDSEATPMANSEKKLSEMAEFRNESKVAREFIQKKLQEQQSLEQQARSASRTDFSRLGNRESDMQKSIQSFQEQHPGPFKGTLSESEQTQESMTKAADALQKRSTDARNAVQQATQDLQKLSDAMNNGITAQQLAQAYKLRQMLDQQSQTFDQRSRPGSNISDEDLQKAIDAARQTLDQLKKTAEQDPTRKAFSQPLRDALNDQNKAELDSALRQLQRDQDEASKQQHAGECRNGLAKVGKAFDQSEPKSMQFAQQNDALKPGGQDSFNTAMAELESLAQQLESHRSISRDDLMKQGREALFNLQTGMKELYGTNERATQLANMLAQMLKAETPMDPPNLKKLMDELRHFSVETADQLATKEDKPEVTNIDPSHLPPAYRGRIQKYFQKLSEK